jgi:hypothetical protein
MPLFRITPRSHWLMWKLHRLILKKIGMWRRLQLPGEKILMVRYRDEGTFNYIFRVRDDSRLLRITKDQFYDPAHSVDEKQTLENSRLMNSLAVSGISVRCEHLVGGACLVEDAGLGVRRQLVGDRGILEEVFTKIKKWSLETGVVILDYNEGNWCIKDGVFRLVDIDVNYTCRLSEICNNSIVLGRLGGVAGGMEDVLVAFLRKEEQLLCDHLKLDSNGSDFLRR